MDFTFKSIFAAVLLFITLVLFKEYEISRIKKERGEIISRNSARESRYVSAITARGDPDRTVALMKIIGECMVAYRQHYKKWPINIKGINDTQIRYDGHSVKYADCLMVHNINDLWGNSFYPSIQNDELTLTSLGADGSISGEGEATDLTLVFNQSGQVIKHIRGGLQK